MKYLFAASFLLVALFTKAQIVNIPDPNFKAALANAGVDTNHDNEIQETEAAAVTYLDVSFNETTSITVQDLTGLRSFVNLETLIANNHSLDSLNISGMKFLRVVSAWASPATLTYLNATGCDSLRQLSIDGLRIGTLDVHGLTKLQSLTIYNVTNLLAAGCIELAFIKSGSNGSGVGSGIENSLDVTGCINLDYIYLQECGITSLDLSSCINFTNFTIYAGTSNFRYLNIKNGRPTTLLLTDPTFPQVLNICADDFEINNVRAGLTTWTLFFPEYLNINSYCSFFPGGKYNTITGTVKLDVNSNGCDITDNAMPNVPVKISDNTGNSLISYGNTTGNYVHYAGKGNFTLIPYFPYPYFTINPASSTVSFDTANSLTTAKDFCIQPNGSHNDLEIAFLPTFTPARPGFDAIYTLIYKNRGTTTLSGTVQVNFDNNKMNFVSASENVTTQSSGQLLWNYNNLKPFESRTINVTFNLLPSPVNNIDDTISYLAVITPSDNDETAFDNIFILPQRVIASYDPNDKQCLEGSKLDISKIGDYLHYQIRFQNEGTDTAFNIVVADTLNNNLDWNSFEFIGSSHAADVKLTNNKLEFFFQDINLPYKAINEPASHGWVAFKIKPKPSVVIGDSINNTASIYFDFNLPVLTNKATTIVSNSSNPVPVKLEYFSVNKKDNSNQLNWKASCTYGNATFIIERSNDGIHFNSIGNINATSLRCQLPFNFIDNNPVAGKNYYRLKITDADGNSFYSKILVVGNNKAGLQIKAVVNNTVYLNSNKQQLITMKIIAADGKEMINQKQAVAAGSNSISMQMRNVTKGIYSLIIYTGEGEIIIKRFIN